MASTAATRFSDLPFSISSLESSSLQLLSESDPDLSASGKFSNLFGRDAREPLKVLGQMTLTRKANMKSNIRDR